MYGEATSNFTLVTNSQYADAFVIEDMSYGSTSILSFEDGEDFAALLRGTPDDAHVLTALPDCLVHSVAPEVLGNRKLLIMACRSGRTSLEAIDHFLRAGETTDPSEQEAFAESFFAAGEAAEYLEIIDEEYGTRARFNHLHPSYEWHEQLGVLAPGDQQVFPSGEIACFLVPLKVKELDQRVSFDVEGKLTLRGRLIVQSGPPSFLVEDQERIYERLSTMAEHAVVVDVKEGDIVSVEPTHEHARPAADMLEALFSVDSRFSRIYEFGFAFNPHVTPWPGNTAMNEVCGGESGQLHAGLGMLPHTQYHIDVFLEGTKIVDHTGSVVFGGQSTGRQMQRRRAASCPCMLSF